VAAGLDVSEVVVNGFGCRVWRKGIGRPLGFLAGYGGLPRWTPFLERLSEERTIIVPSLPGFPGATGHAVLDSHLDWIVAIRQLLSAAGLDGADLAGGSVGASFAAEIAALWPDAVRRLALIAPWGLFDAAAPPTRPWAQKSADIATVLCANPGNWTALKDGSDAPSAIEWSIEQVRANEAAARIFWPLGDTRLERRLPLINAPTLLIWGEQDGVLARSYADAFASGISGRTEIRTIADAGHLADLDQPEATARAILAWTAENEPVGH
jgi:pimeloyl-ACP methyl ester carboxylesterase